MCHRLNQKEISHFIFFFCMSTLFIAVMEIYTEVSMLLWPKIFGTIFQNCFYDMSNNFVELNFNFQNIFHQFGHQKDGIHFSQNAHFTGKKLRKYVWISIQLRSITTHPFVSFYTPMWSIWAYLRFSIQLEDIKKNCKRNTCSWFYWMVRNSSHVYLAHVDFALALL